MLENYKVYVIRNKDFEIVYVGLTGKTIEERFRAHKWSKKLDDTYKVELVQDCLSRIEAAELERRLIKQYKTLENGLNCSPGSLNGQSQMHSKKQKIKWSKERKGRPVSKEHAAKNRIARLGTKNSKKHNEAISKKNSKAVMCVETGKIYKSARQAAKELGLQYSKISLVCNGKRNTTGGLHFIFVNDKK